MKQIFSILITLGFLSGLSALAQEEKGREISVRCLSFANLKNDRDVYLHSMPDDLLDKGEKPPQIRVKTYLNSSRFTVNMVGDRIMFSSSKDPLTAKDEAIATVKVPRDMKQILVVFFPAPKSDDPAAIPQYPVKLIDDSVKAFPRGSILCYNLSEQPVRLMLEKKKYDIKVGKKKLIVDPPANARNHCSMYAYANAEDKWNRIGASLWPHPGPKRILQFFYLNPRSKRVELKGIKDISIVD